MLLAVGSSFAQLDMKTGTTLDRIVAIVGNEIIMQSDIDGTLLQMSLQDRTIDIADREMRKKLLENMISQKILRVKAIEDSVNVSDDLVEERWNAMLQSLVQRVGSVERVEAVYKKSISRIKFEYRDEVKKDLMVEQMEMTKFGNITANSQDIEEFYKIYKDSLPEIPEQVELLHIVKYIHPDTVSKVNTYNLAKNIRDSIMQSGKFGEFAKQYSADLASAQDGGDLGWAGKGKFIQEFEQAAYALQPNEISLPVETPFGYHLIQLVEKKRDSIHTRHLLLKVEQSETDAEKVKNELDSIRKIAIENNNFSELATQLSEEKETQGFGGSMGKHSLDMYPPSIANAAKNLKDGEISEPAPYVFDPTKSAMNIVYRKATIPAHKPMLETDYDYIKLYAGEYKRMNLRNDWIEELKKEIYWEVVEK